MKLISKSILTALGLSIAFAAHAAPETYMTEKNHTFAYFSYNHLGFSTQQSRFDGVSGKIIIDRAAKTGSAEIAIDAKSVNTGSEAFNGHLKGEDYFNVEKFPTLNFKSNKFKFEGDKLVAVEGELTSKGVTKPVTLTVNSFNCQVHPMMKKDACGANATAKIKRSDFANGKNVPYVGDEVTITLNIEAIKQ